MQAKNIANMKRKTEKIDKQKIFELRAEGETYQSIANKVGCSKQYVELVLNPEKRKKRNEQYLANPVNKEKKEAYRKEYYRINREEIKRRREEEYRKNPEKYKNAHKKYYERHKEEIKEKYKKNRDRYLAFQKEWRAKNPDYAKTYYRNKKKQMLVKEEK